MDKKNRSAALHTHIHSQFVGARSSACLATKDTAAQPKSFDKVSANNNLNATASVGVNGAGRSLCMRLCVCVRMWQFEVHFTSLCINAWFCAANAMPAEVDRDGGK